MAGQRYVLYGGRPEHLNSGLGVVTINLRDDWKSARRMFLEHAGSGAEIFLVDRKMAAVVAASWCLTEELVK